MSFFRSIGLNIGAGGVGVAVALFTTPLMTRVFPPTAYGQNGLIISLVSFAASFGLCGLPIAMAREQSGPEQPRLLGASIALILLLTLVAGLLSIAAVTLGWHQHYGLARYVVFLVPLLIAMHAAHLIVNALAIAKGTFSTLASGRVVDAFSARFGTLGLGIAVSPGVVMMLLGDMAGKVVKIIVLLRNRSLREAFAAGSRLPSGSELGRTMLDYGQFAFFANVAQALPLALALVLNWYVVHRVGVTDAGQFVLANSMLSMAVTAIALGAAPVVFHELSRTVDESPEQLNRVALRIALYSAGVGAVCMLPILLFGPLLFRVVFGAAWEAAGELASWLAIPFMLLFSLTVLLPVFRVLRKIRTWFWVQLVAFLGLLFGLYVFDGGGRLSDLGPQLAFLLLLYNASLLVAVFMSLRVYGRDQSGFI